MISKLSSRVEQKLASMRKQSDFCAGVQKSKSYGLNCQLPAFRSAMWDRRLATTQSVANKLERRLGGRVYARQRLEFETDHEAQIFGHGINVFHIENWHSFHSVICTVLKLTGLSSGEAMPMRRARRRSGTNTNAAADEPDHGCYFDDGLGQHGGSTIQQSTLANACGGQASVLQPFDLLCQSRAGFAQQTAPIQPLKDLDHLSKVPRFQRRARIVSLPVAHDPRVGRDQLVLADPRRDDLRHCGVTNRANDRNNIIA